MRLAISADRGEGGGEIGRTLSERRAAQLTAERKPERTRGKAAAADRKWRYVESGRLGQALQLCAAWPGTAMRTLAASAVPLS